MLMEIVYNLLDSAFITVLLIDATGFSERFDGNSKFYGINYNLFDKNILFLTISLL